MKRARWRGRSSLVAVVAVLAASGTPWMAPAQDVTSTAAGEPPRARRSPGGAVLPRALVLVRASEADAFFSAFVHEMVAIALRERGFSTVPPQVAAEALRAAERDPDVCLEEPSCRREVAESLGAVTLLSVRLVPNPTDTRRARATLAVGHAPFDALVDLGAVEGDALALGDALRDALTRVDPDEAPCRVVLRTQVAVEARLGSGPLGFSVRPGTHSLELRVAGRAPWRGALRCVRGEGIEVRVR